MRYLIGFLSGVLGSLAGWFGLAMLVIALAGPDRDGGIAMGAFFNIGPIGGVVGFVVGILLFVKFGLVARQASSSGVTVPDAAGVAVPGAAAPAPEGRRVSPAFAVATLVIVGGLAWWGWYELIRSPYLSHGYMTLDLQFRLPPGMAPPPSSADVHITVEEGSQYAEAILGPRWTGTDGDRRAILAHATLSMKTRHRSVILALPGVQEQTWQIDLPSDPDPTPGYSPWRTASYNSNPKIEMNFRLSAER